MSFVIWIALIALQILAVSIRRSREHEKQELALALQASFPEEAKPEDILLTEEERVEVAACLAGAVATVEDENSMTLVSEAATLFSEYSTRSLIRIVTLCRITPVEEAETCRNSCIAALRKRQDWEEPLSIEGGWLSKSSVTDSSPLLDTSRHGSEEK